ncbi:hypothetical protein [Gordonia westfalica]|uniref:Uncharacterized protein n=3 Tax=Gordonia westfalica TaxID=158898 RepID=A0A1H2DR64_9ACTN|nr:hypothetical protein [Gordonia westfalica]SDT83708.1 hypothetical protein SAMN04488548_10128 [Gordonia westfalica]SDT83726.1 hypothetical protein SAMN04488548_10146 [Gordonia westfalica]SDT83948.1 hypothetical protein SAMN04488548_10536 [Gordonia westfalica]SDT83954.1 hypothetical protein SAMN04488548_10538 [Gordonia westfalica]SDT85274.1 hypothetical protein SAMN04488548_11824 [Gordonia westfalica]
MTEDISQDELFRLTGRDVVLCPECGHGIDPHGTDPGGACGVGKCECMMSPNGIAYALINPEVTPAQKHYAEAERMLAFIEHDRNLTTTQHSEVAARAQVHATLAQAASLREVLESRATTRYHVTVQDEGEFRRRSSRLGSFGGAL